MNNEPDQGLVAAWMESLGYEWRATADNKNYYCWWRIHSRGLFPVSNVDATFFYQACVAAVAEGRRDEIKMALFLKGKKLLDQEDAIFKKIEGWPEDAIDAGALEIRLVSLTLPTQKEGDDE